MSIDPADLQNWFSDRPKWLQDAARRLFQAGQLSTDDLSVLLILCKREAGITVEGHADITARPIPAVAFNVADTHESLCLNAISNITAINALSPRKPLTLDRERLTIIFGSNGSGKSGYIRALKHMCGGRGTKQLHRNVFERTSDSQSCTVGYTLGKAKKELVWSPTNGMHSDLRNLAVYDNDCAQVYVNEENEVAYEPTLLSHFRKLVEACEQISAVLTHEESTKVSSKPSLPPEYASTLCGKWFSQLAYSTDAAAVSARCSWSDDQERQLIGLNQRLAEARPAEKAKTLWRTKQRLADLRTTFNTLRSQLGDEAYSALSACREMARARRQAATVDATRVFENAPLTGVASESWRLLWDAARAFSEHEAYKEAAFPFIDNGARCVLCQQSLGDGAKQRFSAFEAYVRGTLEAAAAEAEKRLASLLSAIRAVPETAELDEQQDGAGISEVEIRQRIHAYNLALKARRDTFLNAANSSELAPMPADEVSSELDRRESECHNTATAYDEDAKTDRKKQLQEQQVELASRKWLSQQKTAVLTEIGRLKEIQLLSQARKLANTRALSDKKSILADALITAAFIKRFEDELSLLGASALQATIRKTKTTKAQIWHQITLKDAHITAKTAEVLSEGELRVVSLAAFLADVAVDGRCTPLIFDDPISSLDHIFEEATAARLAQLSKTRQIIVFTHRLSLLFMLQEAAKKNSIPVEVVSLERQSWGAGEPCGPPLPAQVPSKALNTLYRERLAQARRAWQVEGTPAYAIHAKALCSDIRITVERLIENDLLADVVQRFRRAIHTLNKINKLASIQLDDCALLDGMMTKYSCYEHSQPSEAPIFLPPPDELADDLDKLILQR